jgi:hypothetical protein
MKDDKLFQHGCSPRPSALGGRNDAPGGMYFRGFGPHCPNELEQQCCRPRTRRYGAYDRDSTPRDCLEARGSLLVGRQRDLSSAAGVIDYAVSYEAVHVAGICMTISFIVKWWRMGLL